MQWKLSGRKSSDAERQKELDETNALIFDWKKLEINKGIKESSQERQEQGHRYFSQESIALSWTKSYIKTKVMWVLSVSLHWREIDSFGHI